MIGFRTSVSLLLFYRPKSIARRNAFALLRVDRDLRAIDALTSQTVPGSSQARPFVRLD